MKHSVQPFTSHVKRNEIVILQYPASVQCCECVLFLRCSCVCKGDTPKWVIQMNGSGPAFFFKAFLMNSKLGYSLSVRL